MGEHSGLPVLNLDDFYRDHTDDALPRAWGIVDWDSPDSWHADHALAALTALCHGDQCEIPTYSIPESRRTGTRVMDVSGAPLIIAEGIFAAELVAPLAAQGLLADAIVLDRPASLVWALRFVRDVRQSRKSLPTLVRRGLGLARTQEADVARWAGAGMRRLGLRASLARVRTLARVAHAESHHRPHLARGRSASGARPTGAEQPTIHVSAVCFVYREPEGPGLPDGQWLTLAVRKKGTALFMQPGGKPETEESPVACAVREIKEELGVSLDPERLASLGRFHTAAANEAHTRLTSDVFLAPEVHNPGEFAAHAEIEEVRWFPVDAPDPEAPIAPLFREVVIPELLARLASPATPPATPGGATR